MTDYYIKRRDEIIKALGIEVKEICTKEDIINSKNFSATLKPSIKKLIIK